MMLTRRTSWGDPTRKYFRLWRNITDNLKPHERVAKRPKPEAVYLHAEGALKTLAAQWKKRFDAIVKDADGGHFIPPIDDRRLRQH